MTSSRSTTGACWPVRSRPRRGALERFAGLGVAVWLGVAVSLGVATPASAATLLDWDDLDPAELRIEYLAVERPVTVQISALGTVGREDRELLAFPWILHSESRKVVWQLTPENARANGKERKKAGTRTVPVEAQLALEAGHYEVYFTTFGQRHWVDVTTWFGRLAKKRDIRFGQLEQDPWRLKVTCADSDRNAVQVGGEAKPRFNPLVRLADPKPNSSLRQPFALAARSKLVVYAIGEYSDVDHSLADHGWIERASDQEVVWEMTPQNTTLAGGAEKNRLFRAPIELDPGTYVLCYSSDDSHGPEDWNLNPPLDPAFWGVALFDGGGARPHFSTDVKDPLTRNLIVDLGRQPSSSFNLRGIRVKQPIAVRIQALGEIDNAGNRFADFGWIERARTHQSVWQMSTEHCDPAGGADKNCLARAQIDLQPGEYLVCYWTDTSHAFGDWNATPPRQPDGWGIRVWGAGEKFDPKSVEPYDEDQDPKILAQLQGIGDDRHATERFTVKSKTKVKIIAIGEGTHGQMFDYGWVEQGEGEAAKTLWRMRYSDTVPAGGADKNRREETETELQPGTYVLHYVTDDSHSFQDWNAAPPDQPHLWGVSVIRLQ
jgi:hypothetical protein